MVQEFYFKDQLVCRIFFPGLQAWQEFFFHTGKSLLFVINVFSQRFLPWIKRALIVSMPALNIHVHCRHHSKLSWRKSSTRYLQKKRLVADRLYL